MDLVLDCLAPVLEELGGAIDFNLDYIATKNVDGTFQSLHGEPEVQGNIVQLCAIEHEPENAMKMITCMNTNAQAIPGNWEDCAKEAELDAKIAELEGKEDPMSIAALRVYRRFRAQLLQSKAEVVSKIGKKNS